MFAAVSMKITLQSAMSIAVAGGHLPIMQFLRASGASFDYSLGEKHSTALHGVAKDTTAECIRWLLAQGCSVHAKNFGQHTAVHVAAREGNSEALSLFIAAGAEVNGAGADGLSALHLAAGHDDIASLGVLLQAGADPFACSIGEAALEPLCMAAVFGKATAVRTLVNSSAFRSDARAQKVTGSALMRAAAEGNVDYLWLSSLLRRGGRCHRQCQSFTNARCCMLLAQQK